MKKQNIVQKLKEMVLDKETSLTDILRLGLFVAKKLKSSDSEWLNSELNGYSDQTKLPSYRNISCQLKGLNHIRGEWQPINFENPTEAELLRKCSIRLSVGDLEHLALAQGMLKMPLNSEIEKQLKSGLESPIPSEIARVFDSTQVKGIVDKVKNRVVDWILGLKIEEIEGLQEELLFPDLKEKTGQENSIINNHYTGSQTIIHNMQHSQIQQGTINSSQSLVTAPLEQKFIEKIVDEIKQEVELLKLSLDQKSEIEADLNSLLAQIKSSNPKRLIIKESLSSLRSVLESIVGQVSTSIILQKLALLG